MTLHKPTPNQERQAYRNAVELSLVEFYGKSALCAQELVDGWWKRISSKAGFKSGLFMHPEAINTAADLAGNEVIQITCENEEAYRGLLTKARDRALSSAPAKRGTVQFWRAPRKESNTNQKKQIKQKHFTASA